MPKAFPWIFANTTIRSGSECKNCGRLQQIPFGRTFRVGGETLKTLLSKRRAISRSYNAFHENLRLGLYDGVFGKSHFKVIKAVDQFNVSSWIDGAIASDSR